MSRGDVASYECDLPPCMLQALREGRSEEGYSSILNKRTNLFYKPPNPDAAYNSNNPDVVNWLPNELAEILESHAPTDGDIDEKGKCVSSNAAFVSNSNPADCAAICYAADCSGSDLES
jgi:hypothetical protein